MRKERLLLTGPAGSGKTQRCLDFFRKELLQSPISGLEGTSFFILPTREHQERVHHLLLRDPRFRGVLNFHVLTIQDFVRLKVKRFPDRILSHIHRAWIIRRILSEGTWQWLEKVKTANGLSPVLADFIREAKSALLSPSAFQEKGIRSHPELLFKEKHGDLWLLFKRYEEECERLGFNDPEDEIVRFAEAVQNRRGGRALDLVIFDGFFSFTQAQFLFIGAIKKLARRIIVTLTWEPERARTLFEYSQKTRERLLAMGFWEKNLPARGHRFRSPELHMIERNLFLNRETEARGKETFLSEDVAVMHAGSMAREIEMIGREILRLQRTEGYFFSDFCIILRDILPYRCTLEGVFHSLRIPLDIHERLRLADQGFIRLLLGWLELFKGWDGDAGSLGDAPKGWEAKKFLSFLNESWRGLEPASVDAIEDLGFRMDPPFGFASLRKLSCDPKIPQEIRSALGDFFWAYDGMKSLKTPGELRSFFKEFFKRFLPGFSDTEVAALLNFEELCDRFFSEDLQEGTRPFSQWMSRFQGFLEASLYSARPRSQNRVQVYDVSLSLQKEYPVVFVAGLSHGRFPRLFYENPILKDSERRLFNDGGIAFDTRDLLDIGERFFFYMALTRARQKLYLTYAQLDEQGNEILPSPYLEVAKRASLDRPLKEIFGSHGAIPAWEEVRTGRDLLKIFSYSFDRLENALKDRLMGYFDQIPSLKKDLPVGGDLCQVPEMIRRIASENQLTDPEVLSEIRKGGRVFSPSRLETLANCGYQYFAEALLRGEKARRVSAAIQDGRVLHRLLEKIYRTLFQSVQPDGEGQERSHEKHRDLLEEVRRLIETEFDAVFDEFPVPGEKPFRTQARKQVLKRILLAYCEWEFKAFQADPRFIPFRFEWKFGSPRADEPADAGPLELEYGDGTIALEGRIDRLDLGRDGRSVLIVDYKKRHTLRVSDLREGRSLQLPIYLLAVRSLLGLEPIGFEFRSVADRRKEGLYIGTSNGGQRRNAFLDAGTFENFIHEMQETIGRLILKAREGDIRAQPQSCEHCAYYGLCRFEDWRSIG